MTEDEERFRKATEKLKEFAQDLAGDNESFCLVLQRADDFLIISHRYGDEFYDYCPAKSFLIEDRRWTYPFSATGISLVWSNADILSTTKVISGVVEFLIDADNHILLSNSDEGEYVDIFGSAIAYFKANVKDGDYLKLSVELGKNDSANKLRSASDILEHKRRVEYDQILKG